MELEGSFSLYYIHCETNTKEKQDIFLEFKTIKIYFELTNLKLIYFIIVMILDKIIDAILQSKFRFSSHGFEEIANDNLEENDILFSTVRGELIEDYPTLKPFPACLVMGRNQSGIPIHNVWAFNNSAGLAILITTYIPDEKKWIKDFKERKK
jgi:hypothetical protein